MPNIENNKKGVNNKEVNIKKSLSNLLRNKR